ncbi:hypothetical protein CARUB_v10003161mg [Capsella rubella]|uniref:MADS-box domain-containing protein n=1 Tax=Capsella rubella TaxID=81985 RepID=R0FKQ9_9BRAS|nr:agamous-like MADS-box protein AGL90 [Capsella rubella]EOA22506.1 hypothetical protein CARUB_v10003161mg [Capsella rubella]
MRKLKLSLIADERSRKTTFIKRKKGMIKKLHELTTLCGVQACGVIYSPYLPAPEVWPSKEGVEEVVTKFMEMPMAAKTKKMMNQDTYLREQITKTKEQVEKLTSENRDLEVKQFMFDCLEGKMLEYRYGAKDLHDLHCYINYYIEQLTRRMKILEENGESSSFPPLSVGAADLDPLAIADFPVNVNASAISVASEFFDHIQYQNMNMNQNMQEPVQNLQEPVQYLQEPVQYLQEPVQYLQEPVQYLQEPVQYLQEPVQYLQEPVQYLQEPVQYPHEPFQYMQEPFQYQAFPDRNGHIQEDVYNNMTWNPTMNLDLSHNLNLNLDMNLSQYLNQENSFKDMMVEQNVGYAGGYAKIPFIDGNHSNYRQQPTVDLDITNHMPFITSSTTSTLGAYASYNNNYM